MEKKVINALDKMFDEQDVVTPDQVVEEARNPKSPLHKYFEWDDRKAGELYRKEQARSLLQRYEIVEGKREIRGYVHVPSLGGYTRAERVIKDVDLFKEHYNELRRKAEALVKELDDWAALAPTKLKPAITAQAIAVEKVVKDIDKIALQRKSVPKSAHSAA